MTSAFTPPSLAAGSALTHSFLIVLVNRLQQDNGYAPIGAPLVLFVGRVASGKLRPESLPFFSDGLHCTHPSCGSAYLHLCIRVLLEVEPPGGVTILPGVRAYDYKPAAILEVGEGDGSQLTAAPARGDLTSPSWPPTGARPRGGVSKPPTPTLPTLVPFARGPRGPLPRGRRGP